MINSNAYSSLIWGSQWRERIYIILTFSNAKQICNWAHLIHHFFEEEKATTTGWFGWWLTVSLSKLISVLYIDFVLEFISVFSSFRAVLGVLVRCVAVCFYHLRAGVSRQSWGLLHAAGGRHGEAAASSSRRRRGSLILHPSCMLSSNCPCF